MADARSVTYGLDFDVDDGINKIDQVEEKLGAVSVGARQAEIGAQKMGAQCEDSAERVDGAADKVGSDFVKIGRSADSLGDAFTKSMGTAAREGGSASKSIKAGFDGAFAFSEKRFAGFTKKLQTGAKNMGAAFLHPIQTIKGKLTASMKSAGEGAKELGDEADGAGDKLHGAGEEGAAAGDKIKDAFKGAVKAIIGIEAIKKGLELMTKFVGAAVQAAGAAENVGAKFEASFGDQAAGAQQWAENFSKSTHRAENEVKGFLTSSQAMYASMGMTSDAAADLSKMTTSLGYDIGAAFNMDDAEAVTALQDAIKGNGEALAEYGVRLDEATLAEKAKQMGVTKELSDLDEVTLAQIRFNSILEQTEGVQRAAVEQNDGLVNSTKGLKAIFTDFMGNAGAKFAPVLEKLFGVVSEKWPVIEPMLMQFVSVLSVGLEQAVPVLMDLGMTLIPVLSDVLGTLFQAASPLLSVFGSLAQTILPPLASILGLLGETFLPPVTEILNTLNTSIIQPLMPPLQRIAEAVLPPIGQLLAAISPILVAISPVLGVIGDVLGFIAEVLGKVIGWLADGVGKVTGFFSKLFGGAKDSKQEVENLSGAMSDLGAAAGDVEAPVLAVTAPDVPVAEIPPIGAVDTAPLTASVADANTQLQKDSAQTWKQIDATTDEALKEIGIASEDTYALMGDQSDSMWQRMVAAAQAGANRIVDEFRRIGAAASGVSGAQISVSGVDIPHNASGTTDFGGGWTHINEQGGEVAFLPEGSSILPADKSEQLIKQVSGGISPPSISVPVSVKIEGNADESVIQRAMEEAVEKFKAAAREVYREMVEEDSADMAVQEAYS